MSSTSHVVIDTNVLSYMLERSVLGIRYEELLADRIACVAVVTPEELYFGAEKNRWGERRRCELEALVAEHVLLPTSLEIARLSARIRAERRRAGRPIELADAWIAATALWHQAPLATHDRDFEGIAGLELVTTRTHLFLNDFIVGERTAPPQVMHLT